MVSLPCAQFQLKLVAIVTIEEKLQSMNLLIVSDSGRQSRLCVVRLVSANM